MKSLDILSALIGLFIRRTVTTISRDRKTLLLDTFVLADIGEDYVLSASVAHFMRERTDNSRPVSCVPSTYFLER